MGMTLRQFDHGYGMQPIKICASPRCGPRTTAEEVIRRFLPTAANSPTKRDSLRSGVKNVDRGLGLDSAVILYTNDPETKAVLEREARNDPRSAPIRLAISAQSLAEPNYAGARITIAISSRRTSASIVRRRHTGEYPSGRTATSSATSWPRIWGPRWRPASALEDREEMDAPKNDTALTPTRGTKPGASRQRS